LFANNWSDNGYLTEEAHVFWVGNLT